MWLQNHLVRVCIFIKTGFSEDAACS
jgi:hypothetical protein